MSCHDHVNEAAKGTANYDGVGAENVLLATGSTSLMCGVLFELFAVPAELSSTPMPTYSTSLQGS